MSRSSAPVKRKLSHDFAFGGPWGTLGIQISLPVFILGLVAWGKQFGSGDSHLSFSAVNFGWSALFLVLWFGFQAFIYLLPIGKVVEGLPLRNGKRLKYRCNALQGFLIALSVAAAGYFGLRLPLEWAFENIFSLAAAAILYTFVLSAHLYNRSFKVSGDELAEHGTSGYPVYDFFMGRELNPRVGKFDWKFFCELRPGLIGWVLLELSMLAWQYQKIGSVSVPLVFLIAFHAWYVADALWNEPAVLSTKDIIEEGFGFMLVFGDMAFLPFLYSSQTAYVATAQPEVSYLTIAVACALHVVGYIIFRQSNLQKNWFRNNPNDPRVKGFATVPTGVPGKNLLCGGWWSVVRHPNYLGDLLMGLGWTAICGFGSIYPLIYCVYFFVLLIHREIRDEKVCHDNAGSAICSHLGKSHSAVTFSAGSAICHHLGSLTPLSLSVPVAPSVIISEVSLRCHFQCRSAICHHLGSLTPLSLSVPVAPSVITRKSHSAVTFSAGSAICHHLGSLTPLSLSVPVAPSVIISEVSLRCHFQCRAGSAICHHLGSLTPLSLQCGSAICHHLGSLTPLSLSVPVAPSVIISKSPPPLSLSVPVAPSVIISEVSLRCHFQCRAGSAICHHLGSLTPLSLSVPVAPSVIISEVSLRCHFSAGSAICHISKSHSGLQCRAGSAICHHRKSHSAVTFSAGSAICHHSKSHSAVFSAGSAICISEVSLRCHFQCRAVAPSVITRKSHSAVTFSAGSAICPHLGTFTFSAVAPSVLITATTAF
ncbi:Lamin-B receptor [Hypsibius exemplaris]|uniref:Lamin-B receptor n=1 Tax=Hypsibius exemplaris TaxID=2072580 RepID=A0A1W0WKW1_HYPEX|nr:Lamin-B receptor [Hypsibius exemplaris]